MFVVFVLAVVGVVGVADVVAFQGRIGVVVSAKLRAVVSRVMRRPV